MIHTLRRWRAHLQRNPAQFLLFLGWGNATSSQAAAECFSFNIQSRQCETSPPLAACLSRGEGTQEDLQWPTKRQPHSGEAKQWGGSNPPCTRGQSQDLGSRQTKPCLLPGNMGTLGIEQERGNEAGHKQGASDSGEAAGGPKTAWKQDQQGCSFLPLILNQILLNPQMLPPSKYNTVRGQPGMGKRHSQLMSIILHLLDRLRGGTSTKIMTWVGEGKPQRRRATFPAQDRQAQQEKVSSPQTQNAHRLGYLPSAQTWHYRSPTPHPACPGSLPLEAPCRKYCHR